MNAVLPFLAKGNTDYVLVTEGQFTSEVWMSYNGDYSLVKATPIKLYVSGQL